MTATASQLAYRSQLHAPAMQQAEARTHAEAARMFRNAADKFSLGSPVHASLIRQALHHRAIALMCTPQGA
jgi:hypothetical protein